jgi:hypothetical protein
MKRVFFVVIMLACYLNYPVYAQNKEEKGKFKAFSGLTLPLGFFGENEGRDQDGYAKPGLGFGLEYSLPIGLEEIEGVADVAFLINGCDVSNVFDAEAGQWINIPILAGLKYESEVSSKRDAYCLFQAGVNFTKPPLFEFSDGSEISYDVSSSFGFSVGGGFVIRKKFDLGLRYLNLGKPKLKGTWDDWAFTDVKQPISLLVVSVGFIFD